MPHQNKLPIFNVLQPIAPGLNNCQQFQRHPFEHSLMAQNPYQKNYEKNGCMNLLKKITGLCI